MIENQKVFVLTNPYPCFGFGGKSHKPKRDWHKSQKKIRREKRQKGYRK